MIIGERLRQLRESKKLSQGHVENRTGLLRCYISRVENGHTVPNIETLEKLASALEVPMYKLFYDGDKPARKPDLNGDGDIGSRASEVDAAELRTFRKLLGRMTEERRKLLFAMAQRMAKRRQ